ncbi:MAG: carboxypeptidase regulatory-like domain-containing protein [Candidatus Thermoplasmatota archaeon]|nr:carboxypeptidase regulatory-like domain-containing protein [Candidatus Thermoplasmatota archaeon]
MSAFVVMPGFSTGTGGNELFAESEDIHPTLEEPSLGAEVNIYPDRDTNLSVTVTHDAGTDMNVTFYGNKTDGELEKIGENTSVASGEYANMTWQGLDFATQYTWYVNVTEDATDGGDDNIYNESEEWTFTTADSPIKITMNEPMDGAGLETYPDRESNLSVTVYHEGDPSMLMNVTFYGNEMGEELEQIGENTSVADGEYANMTWEDLDYDTEYEWYVHVYEDATDGGDEDIYNESATWTFSTDEIITERTPTDGAEVDLDPELNVTVQHPEGNDLNVTFYGNETGETLEEIYNETVESGEYATFVWDNRDFDTTYDWKVVVEENQTDEQLKESNVWNFTTEPEVLYKLTFTVMDEEGDPIEGATVTVSNETLGPDYTNTTNDTGVAVVEDVEEGDYTYTVTKEGYEDATAEITVDGDDDITVTMTEKVYDLTFTINDEEGDPIEGATVTVANETLNLDYTNTTDDTGVAVVEDVEEGDYTYTVSKEGYKDATDEITADEDKMVTAHLEEADQPDFKVEITNYDEEMEAGKYIMVEYTIRNEGDVEGTQNISFFVEGSEEDREEDVTIEAGENHTGKFFWEAEVGSHLLTVASEDDEDTVAVNVQMEQPSLLPGFTSLLLILAAIFAVAIYQRKSKKR